MQKKAVRIIAHSPYNSHTHEIFQRFNILKLEDIYHLYLGKYMYSQLNNILPEPLLNKYRLCRDMHPYNTRHANLLFKKTKRTALVANSFINRGLDYWNILPEYLKECKTFKSFDKRHQIYLINAYAQ